MSDDVLTIETRFPPDSRIVVFLAGAACLAFAAWAMLTQPGGPETVFYILMFITGLVFVGGAIFGYGDRWKVSHNRIEISRRNPFGPKSHRFGRGAIRKLRIEKIWGNDTPTTWAVVLETEQGSTFWTSTFPTREEEEALINQIEATYYGKSR